ncbi:MAG: hypothetical protein KGL19_11065 [Bacteroidota bacterium]|nr:hypothetical protein [Bacteroidota bacterium]
MLTANIYIYDSVYTNWGLSNQTLVYALSGTSNLQDYSLDKVQFYKDGTFDEVRPNGILFHGTWSMNVDSSQLITASPGFSGTAVIDTLTMTKLVWRDLNTHNRGVQIPKK